MTTRTRFSRQTLHWRAWLPLLGSLGLWLLVTYLRVFECEALVADLPPQSGWMSTVSPAWLLAFSAV